MSRSNERLAAAHEAEDEIVKLKKKIRNQRLAFRQLHRAHSSLWKAIRIMNPGAVEAILDERRQLRLDDLARKSAAVRDRAEKVGLKVFDVEVEDADVEVLRGLPSIHFDPARSEA